MEKIAREGLDIGNDEGATRAGHCARRNCVAKKFSPVGGVTKEIMNGSDALVA